MKTKILIILIILVSISIGLLVFNSRNVNAQLADSPWPTFRGNLKNTGLSPYDTSHIDGTIKWEFRPIYSQSDVPLLFDSSATIGPDGTIYVGSHENNFYALNPDGTEKWMIDLGEPVLVVGGLSDGYKRGIHSSAAISADGTIYIRSFSNYLYAINPDGTEKWKYPMLVDSDSWSSPTIALDGTIYVGSSHMNGINGFLYALNPDGTLKWKYEAQSDIFPTATIADDGTIYIGAGGDGHFYALNPNGTLKWKFPTGRHTETTVAIGRDGTLYFGNWDEKFYAVNPDGTEKWSYLTGGVGIVASPAIASDGTIYLNADDGYLHALNPDGTVKWKYDTGDPAETSSSPSIGADRTIYFGIAWKNNVPNFLALNPDGTLKWSKLIGGIAASPTIGGDGTVYISTHSGLYAFGGSSASASSISEGDLIRAIDGIDVYIVKYVGSKKFKRLILSPNVFNSYGHLRWQDIIDVSQAVIDTFTTSNMVRATVAGDTRVYKLFPNGDEGIKQWVKTAEAFNRLGYDWDAIYTINETDRDAYAIGSIIE